MLLILFLHATAAAALSIGSVSDNKALEFYPNWVPFKNKHGDELGEFVDVVPKAKVKKRLALPVNFLLRAVAEPQDDYYEKGQADGGDGEDYFEKKDWSDLNRPVHPVDPAEPTKLNNLTDIDGIIHIITQDRPSLADAIKNSSPGETRTEENKKEILKDDDRTRKAENDTDSIRKEEPTLKKEHKYEDDIDYDETPQFTQKRRPDISSEEEQLENEAKKKIILDSVDELKERHADEQRAISEKVKEEEFDKELHERDQMHVRKQHDKYADRHSKRRGKVTAPDYEEYEERGSWRDKYDVRSDKITTTTVKPTRNTPTAKYVKFLEPGKVSVFRNPSLYVIDEEYDSEESTVPPLKPITTVSPTPTSPRRFSSKYTITTTEGTTKSDYPVQVSLTTEPNTQTTKEDEPTLFFPKLKNKRRRKTKTTVAPDSFVAETVEDTKDTKLADLSVETFNDTTAPDSTEDYRTTAMGSIDYKTTGSDNDNIKADYNTTAPDYVPGTGPTGDAVSTNSDTVTDAVPPSSDHKKEEPKEYHEEKGGGHEHHSEHESEHEEHGKKAYEGLHKDSKTNKGHHDKEDHLGKYEDHGGFDKKHHDEKEHYGKHHHEEHGKKHAKYEESGKHSKGHSTKGSHDIHKKEEYEKNVEFFEEEGDSGEEEKHGGFNEEKEHMSGAKYKKGQFKGAQEERKKGESGHFEKGGDHFVHKGHKSSGGHDHHGKRGGAHHVAKGHQGGKKWIYHHGYPAKTANLVVIDRRADPYSHGPNYYG